MRRNGRPVTFRSWDDFNRAMQSLRQVEDWLVAAKNLAVDREFQSAPGNVTVRVTAVADAYGVFPGRFLFRMLDNQVQADTNWQAITETTGTAGGVGGGNWDGSNCTVVPLDEEFPLEKNKRYEGRVIGYWGVGDGTTGTYQYNGWPVVLAYTEEKVHFQITGYDAGTDLYSGSRVKANGASYPVPLSLVYRIQRFPSNWPSPPGGTPAVPVIGVGQVVECKTDPERDGYWYKVDAVGGLTAVHMYDADCNKGYLVTRDGVFVADAAPPPPPPAPAVDNKYYCTDDGAGGRICSFFPRAPAAYISGPYDDRPTCQAACTTGPTSGVLALNPVTWADSIVAAGGNFHRILTAVGGTAPYTFTSVTITPGTKATLASTPSGANLTVFVTASNTGAGTETVSATVQDSMGLTATSTGTITVT